MGPNLCPDCKENAEWQAEFEAEVAREKAARYRITLGVELLKDEFVWHQTGDEVVNRRWTYLLNPTPALTRVYLSCKLLKHEVQNG